MEVDSPNLFEDITPEKDGGVTKTLIRNGEGNDHPFTGCTVHVHYVGRLLDGDKFDSSRDRAEIFSFQVGRNSVIKAWELAVLTMCKNEICEIKVAPEYGYGEEGFPPKIPNNATLLFEIELLSWEDENVTEDGGVKKRIIKEGDGISRPNLDAHVKCHIRGTFNGNLFDERDVEFTIGDGYEYEIVEGIEKALLKMRGHERAKVFIQPDYAFKEVGHSEFGIPAGAAIEYEICLFSFDKALELYDMDYDQKLIKAQSLKDRALKFFQRSEYKKAIEQYNRLMKFVQINEQDSDYPKGVPMLISTNNNLALSYLKLKDYISCVTFCDKVLVLDKNNVKAYYRKSEAFIAIKDYETAINCLQDLLKLEPNNTAAKKQLTTAKSLLLKQVESEKKLYSSIFSKLGE